MSAFPHLRYWNSVVLDRINQGSGYSVFSTTSLYFFASESNIPDVLENSARDIPSLEISFQTTLVAFALLLIVSIFCDKFGIKLSIPGSIFLFFLGLFINIENFTFETIPLEQVHVIALCVLLFFSGLTSDRLLLKRSNLLFSSMQLALFGTAFSMLFWLVYVRFGLGLFQRFGYAEGVENGVLTLITVVIIYSLSVSDWNSFSFVARKVKKFQTVLTNVFKVETAISAAISVAVAEILVLLWLQINPEYTTTNSVVLLQDIFKGILLGVVCGMILGYLLNLVIRHFVTSKPQLVLVAFGFTILGYAFSDLSLRHGGYLCALVMGIVTSLSYRSSSTEDEIEFLSEELESLNIACEAILFFAIGLGLDAKSFLIDFPVAIYVWLGVIAIRPVCVRLFLRGETIATDEKRVLSSWSPKGAVSMALVVQAPVLLEEMFQINLSELAPLQAYQLMANSVCGAVIISMLVKSVFIPKLHERISANSKLVSEPQA